MGLLNKFILLLVIVVASGCSLDASIERPSTVLTYDSNKITGLISGSTQLGTTIGGTTTYTVQSSVGSPYAGIEKGTDNLKYKVYDSVQGAIISSSK